MSATIREQLRKAQFLETLTESAIHQLAKLVTPRSFEADSVLFKEGAQRRFMAILTSGSVAIEKSLNGRPVRLVTLGAGEAVGEGVLLDPAPHGTTARALQRTEAYVLSVEQLDTLVKEFPSLYAALISRAARSISHRLAATDATLVGRGRLLGVATRDRGLYALDVGAHHGALARILAAALFGLPRTFAGRCGIGQADCSSTIGSENEAR